MKTPRTYWNHLRSVFSRIHLVDKCLIAFMVLLLFQSAYNLFVNHTAAGEAGNIDVIVRTSIAGIFGYFLSINFIRSDTSAPPVSKPKDTVDTMAAEESGSVRNRIGFSAPGTDDSADRTNAGTAEYRENRSTDPNSAHYLQIIIASFIGIFCLVTLFILRNVSGMSADMTVSPSATATVAQFRDIVSGCVGFLIGCPTSGTKR